MLCPRNCKFKSRKVIRMFKYPLLTYFSTLSFEYQLYAKLTLDALYATYPNIKGNKHGNCFQGTEYFMKGTNKKLRTVICLQFETLKL